MAPSLSCLRIVPLDRTDPPRASWSRQSGARCPDERLMPGMDCQCSTEGTRSTAGRAEPLEPRREILVPTDSSSTGGGGGGGGSNWGVQPGLRINRHSRRMLWRRRRFASYSAGASRGAVKTCLARNPSTRWAWSSSRRHAEAGPVTAPLTRRAGRRAMGGGRGQRASRASRKTGSGGGASHGAQPSGAAHDRRYRIAAWSM